MYTYDLKRGATGTGKTVDRQGCFTAVVDGDGLGVGFELGSIQLNTRKIQGIGGKCDNRRGTDDEWAC